MHEDIFGKCKQGSGVFFQNRSAYLSRTSTYMDVYQTTLGISSRCKKMPERVHATED